jgi:putative transposase
MSELTDAELTDFLGRKQYERLEGSSNYRNGSYARKYTLKVIGKVSVRVPRNRKGDFETHVIHRRKQFEEICERTCVSCFSAKSAPVHFL